MREGLSVIGGAGALSIALASAALAASSACTLDWTVLPNDAGAAVDSGAADAGRSCRQPSDCGKDQVCLFADRRCGAGVTGKCSDIPATCNEPVEVVCRCDGNTEKSACLAQSAGKDVSAEAPCVAPSADVFRCGYRFCPSAKTFCLENGAAGDVEYKCTGTGCATVDCSCPDVVDALSRCPGGSCQPVAGGVIILCKR